MAQVKVQEGVLQGEFLENEYGKPYYSFKGIPYAEPPIGELRFKAPKPAKPWVGVRSAKEFGPCCYQRDLFVGTPPGGSEDCLYLNVYSPDLKPSKPLPVMFWIHGGGFFWGSGDDNMYGPEFLINHEVILVTINYRLGVVGFLSLGTEDVPGNAGMKDQVLALKWVRRNIENFGGDPNNITIFGESAGAGSVGFHLISPMSKGLFKRAILQSGSTISPWVTNLFPREKAMALARKLGCYSEDDKELYEFFKKQPIESFLDLSNLEVTQAHKPVEISFSIVKEKDFGNERFFYGDVFDWLRKGISKEVEVLMGYTEHEGALGLGAMNCFAGDVEKYCSFANKFLEYFVPYPMTRECPLSIQLDIGRKFKKFFIRKGIVSKDNIEDLVKYITMDLFAFDIVSLAKFCAKDNNTYLYKFTCKSERNHMKDIFGVTELFNDKPIVCHSDDLAYMFPLKFLDQKIRTDSDTFKLIDNVSKLWTNFAKHGNPTPDKSLGAKWSPFSAKNQDYLDIGNELVAKKFPDKEIIEFWENTYKEYLPHRLP